MADDRPAEARRVVLQRVIANALRTDYPTAPEWENYEDIGEHDWEQIATALDGIAEGFDPGLETYEAACEFLGERAEQ